MLYTTTKHSQFLSSAELTSVHAHLKLCHRCNGAIQQSINSQNSLWYTVITESEAVD